ncbi:MAG: S8 family serine peptidase [Pseudomonadota bacterium]
MKKSTASTISAMACAVAFGFVSSLAIAAPQEQRFIIQYKDGQSSEVRNALNRAGAKIARDLSGHNAVAAHIPTAALQGLSRNPNIEFIEEDVKRYPLATQFEPDGIPYGISMVQADLVSEVTVDPEKTVCIIDSGIDLSHPEFESQFNITGTSDSGTGDWYTDEVGHGTHVAGTVAALKNDEGVIGVNSSGVLNIHIIKVFGADGWAYSSDLVAALDACENAGADVVSMSLGGNAKSRSESLAFDQAEANGILSIAAAGNGGNTRKSYPASYDSVVSIAAIDANMVIADFSQQNDQVELSAPGVLVVSSVPLGTGLLADVEVDGTGYETFAMEGSPMLIASGVLVDCGTAETVCAATGSVCLIERGVITFAEKVLNCQDGGGIGAIIYNNEPGAFLGTLGDTVTTIPSVSVSDTDGASMVPGSDALVSVYMGDYSYYDGTSMATPHVSGVAALIWNNAPDCSSADVREAMAQSALDLGDIGRDNAYGFGLVQAVDAKSLLLDPDFCGGSTVCDLGQKGDACVTDADCCSELCRGRPGAKVCR